MTTENAAAKRQAILKHIGWFLFWTLIFSITYCQAPLYFSNQHQYFLHGLADAGYGYLNEDWLANTKDPTPIFTWLVANTYRYLDARLFYIYYALLMGIYFSSLVGIFSVIAGDRATPLMRLGFVTLLLLIHSAALRCLSARLFGVDYMWYFQAGVAGQYVLGPMFQPSTFGVLLILSIYHFAKDRPLLAVTCSSLGAVLHTTYLLGAAMLTLAYIVSLLVDRRIISGVVVGVWALALVSHIVAYNAMTFQPTSAATFAAAQHIIVHDRIPHHTIPRLWCDEIAVLQIAWIVLGIALTYRTRLFALMLVPFLLGAALTIVQIVTNSDMLALLFPWRISVILLPIATAVICARLVVFTSRYASRLHISATLYRCACALVIAGLVIAGVAIMSFHLGFQTRDQEFAMLTYIRTNKSPGDTYAIPAPVPNLKEKVYGSQKSDFRPLRALDKNTQFIPVNLQRFRLYTGAPIFVDFKSIPYYDRDVIEWWNRIGANQQFYRDVEFNRPIELAAALRRDHISHIVVTKKQQVKALSLSAINAAGMLASPFGAAGVTAASSLCPGRTVSNSSRFESVYKDNHYQVYRVK